MEQSSVSQKKIKPIEPRLTVPGADSVWTEAQELISLFRASVFCYLKDSEAQKYPIHSSAPLDVSKQRQGYGCFFSVNGFRDTSSREIANLYCLNGCYVDIDWPIKTRSPEKGELDIFKRDVLESLSSLEFDGMMPSAINETKNGYHAFWLFPEPIFLDDIKADSEEHRLQRQHNLFELYRDIQSALIERFQGDVQCKDLTRVMRVPGTLHLKDPKTPFEIKTVYFNPGNRYTIQKLRDHFLSKQYVDKNEKEYNRMVPDAKGNIWIDASGATYAISPDVLKALNETYPKVERPSIQALMQRDGQGEGARNTSLMIAVSACRECAWSQNDCEVYFDHYNGLSIYEIRSVIRSAYSRPTPLEYGWNHPLIASRLTEVERARVNSIIFAESEEKRREKKIQAKLKAEANGEDPTIQVTKDIDLEKKAARTSEAADAAYQKAMYKTYEDEIAKQHPSLRYLEDVGFYAYTNGSFDLLTFDKVRAMINQAMLKDSLLNYRVRASIENKLICLQAKPEIRMTRDDNEGYELLNVTNGLLNLRTGKLTPHSMDTFVCTRTECEYDTSRPLEEVCPRWLRFIDEIAEKSTSKARLLQQIAGYCLTQNVTFQKAFIFYGQGGNGKSTFINMIQRLLGKGTSSSLSLKDLQQHFSLASLYGSRLNITEEIDHNYVESDQIKKIITGAELTADRKYLSPLIFRPYAKLVFAVNTLPKINDTSHGLYRRFDIIPFNARFDTALEPDLEETLWRERNGVLRWCMEGYQHLLKEKRFEVPEDVRLANEDFKEANSPLVEFILRTYDIKAVNETSETPVPLVTIYEEFKEYLKNMGYAARSYQHVVKEVSALTHASLKRVRMEKTGLGHVVFGLKRRDLYMKKAHTPFNGKDSY